MIKHYGITQTLSNIILISTGTIIAFLMTVCEIMVNGDIDAVLLIMSLVIGMVMALVFKLFVISMGNVIRFLMWKSQGDGHTMPIPIMFFVFSPKPGNIKLRIDPSFMETPFIPGEVLMGVNDGKLTIEGTKERIIKIEKRVIVIQSMTIVCLAAIMVIMKTYLFTIIPVVAAVSFFSNGLVRNNIIHGIFVQIHCMSGDLWPIYFGMQAFLYCKKDGIISDALMKIEQQYREDESIELQLLVALQMIFLRKCSENGINLSDTELQSIESYWLDFRIDRWFLTKERLNLLKLYLWWAIRENDDARRKRVGNMFRYLIESEDLGEKTRKKLREEYNLLLQEDFYQGQKIPIADEISFARNFPEYEEIHKSAFYRRR